jgi:hypothetical protein
MRDQTNLEVAIESQYLFARAREMLEKQHLKCYFY